MPEIQHILTGFHVGTDQGQMGFCTVSLIRGKELILVDVGHVGRANLLKESLEKSGVQLGDIKTVILTHAHWDHCQNIDMFPEAKILISGKELEYARNPKKGDFATNRYFLDTLRKHEVEEVGEGAEIEPGISIIETPGHTKGSISVLVDTSDGKVAISGDALPWAKSVVTGQPMIIFWDEQEAVDSIRKLLAASQAFYPGHDRPFRVRDDNAVEYIGGADTIRLLLRHEGIGDVTLKVAPDAPDPLTVIPND